MRVNIGLMAISGTVGNVLHSIQDGCLLITEKSLKMQQKESEKCDGTGTAIDLAFDAAIGSFNIKLSTSTMNHHIS